MIPTGFVQIDSIPLTSNGKADHRALAALQPGRQTVATVFRAPTTPLQARLTEIWRDVLRAHRVGLDDNFFDLGGDSIKAIQVVARAVAAGVSLTPQDVFRHQTVAELAGWIQSQPAPETTRLPVKPEDDGAAGVPFRARVAREELDKLAAILERGGPS
jgi:aryl carrier-like protein